MNCVWEYDEKDVEERVRLIVMIEMSWQEQFRAPKSGGYGYSATLFTIIKAFEAGSCHSIT